MNNKYTLLIALAVSVATGSSTIYAAYSVDAELRSLIEKHGLTGEPSTDRTVPSIRGPKAQ
ncbi:MAG: hypothetical protein WBP46_04285 [Thiolinea sp.]